MCTCMYAHLSVYMRACAWVSAIVRTSAPVYVRLFACALFCTKARTFARECVCLPVFSCLCVSASARACTRSRYACVCPSVRVCVCLCNFFGGCATIPVYRRLDNYKEIANNSLTNKYKVQLFLCINNLPKPFYWCLRLFMFLWY